MSRRAHIERMTKETSIRLDLHLDGSGQAEVRTGIPFFDHMLTAFAAYSWVDLRVEATGDLAVEGHHTVEDVGICLGRAVAEALGDKAGISRFGDVLLPMDEALSQIAIDLSGRPFLAWNVPLHPRAFGDFHTELAPEFWRAFAMNAGATLHVTGLAGENAHHVLESVWKGIGRALGEAVAIDPRRQGVTPSTKGVL